MNLVTLIIQIFLTIPLTMILNLMENKKNRSINYIIIPTIYIIIISALIPSIKENIFLIVVFEIFIRNFYITSIVNQEIKLSNTTFIIESLLSIILSLFTYNYFISSVNTVIPNPEEIKPFLWFIIILYLSNIYQEINITKQNKQKNKEKLYKTENIIIQYAKFKNKYSQFVKSRNNIINNLVYSIMIYNDFKKPRLYRNITSYLGAITKTETEYGIMRVKSYSHLTDEESIKEVISTFEKELKGNKLKEKEKVEKLLNKYSEVEKIEIKSIYEEIKKFNSLK